MSEHWLARIWYWIMLHTACKWHGHWCPTAELCERCWRRMVFDEEDRWPPKP